MWERVGGERTIWLDDSIDKLEDGLVWVKRKFSELRIQVQVAIANVVEQFIWGQVVTPQLGPKTN